MPSPIIELLGDHPSLKITAVLFVILFALFKVTQAKCRTHLYPLTEWSQYSTWTNVPKIKGIPEIPGALPFVGHLHLLGGTSGRNDVTVWSSWVKKYGWNMFQLRMGNERVVVVNDFMTVKELWAGSSSTTLISRPTSYTMETIIGVQLGAAPWNDVTKRQRGAAIRSVASGMWQSYFPLLDKNSRLAIEDMMRDSNGGMVALDPWLYLSRISLDLGFTITYGRKLEDLGGLPFLRGFINEGLKISE
jgi:phenylacetate 2-hydroxylase